MNTSLAVVAFLACCGLSFARSYLPSRSSLGWSRRGSAWDNFGDNGLGLSRWNRPLGFRDNLFHDSGDLHLNSGLLHHGNPAVVSSHRRYRRDVSYLPRSRGLGLDSWNSFNSWDRQRWGTLGGLSNSRYFPSYVPGGRLRRRWPVASGY